VKTHIELDEDTLTQVLEMGGFPSKKAAVSAALEELLNRLRRERLLKMPGRVTWEGELETLRATRDFSAKGIQS
jgi:Arc/MetJ family transcription regulator